MVMRSPTKSCSPDPIPTSVMKQCLDLLLPVITSIINLSLSTGEFNSAKKLALITPLIKKLGLLLVVQSFRPVSNLMFH